MINHHLVLIGFMGVGKTTVGRRVAKKLGLNFCDLDSQIVQKYGAIQSIFKDRGESYFRDIEYKTFVSSLKVTNPLVISTGGGIITHKPSLNCLENCLNIIWLQASFNTVLKRVHHDASNKRPLVDDQIQERFKSRQLLYESVSSFTVNVDHIRIEEVAEKIINRYG
ncbi:MAG: shikimate kinase [Candidatus Margulisiibacteriota bacterium]|nr:shikimate kinase [Candidatus Margulisiibacteriota bacterium]